MHRRRIGVCLLFLLLAAVPRPLRAEDLLAPEKWTLVRPAEGDATLETVPAEGAPGGNKTALRITVARPAEPFYRIMIAQDVARAVPADTRLRLRFWARSPTGNPLRAVVEKAGPPYTGALEATPTLTKEWKQYTASGTPPAYGPNGLAVRLQVGHQAGTVELAGIALEDLGPDPAAAAARAAVQPAAVQARIRRYRMGDLTVLIRDRRGRPGRTPRLR